MVSIQTRAHVGTDGRLDVELPAEYHEKNVNVTISVEPADSDRPGNAPAEPMTGTEIWQQARRESKALYAKWESEPKDENGWPLSFLDDTYGCLADDPIERLPQGELEAREEID